MRMRADFGAHLEAVMVDVNEFSSTRKRCGQTERKFVKFATLNLFSLPATALLSISVAFGFGGVPAEITLPGTRIFPESITSTTDGTLIIGSWGHGNILRIPRGKTMAEEWIKVGTGGLNNVLGVLTDEKDKTLWVCSDELGRYRRTDCT
jgi:hypothetical protein